MSTLHFSTRMKKSTACALRHCRYLLHHRDTKCAAAFRAIIETGHVTTPISPLEVQRWVRSVKDGRLPKVILCGDRSLRRTMSEYVTHDQLSEIIRTSPTSCCCLASRRCAAPNRCDATSGAGFCAITIKRLRESPCHFGRERPLQLAAYTSYVLFLTLIDGKLMSRGGCKDRCLRVCLHG